MPRVPVKLSAGISALLILIGSGGKMVYDAQTTAELMQHEYIQAVAGDAQTSEAVKVAMVMGSYYESSYRHIGTPYIDRMGKGQPLTVCNGITGAGVVAGVRYAPQDCYRLERGRYLDYERTLRQDVPAWAHLGALQQAVFMDFLHNKGEAKWRTSTMRRLLLAGDVDGACRQNERWTRGTVDGVSTVLPGLVARANANTDLCLEGNG
ncbi:MAG: endolysin [Candidatus Paceibacterota bacterium]